MMKDSGFIYGMLLSLLVTSSSFCQEPSNTEIMRIKNFLADEMYDSVRIEEANRKNYYDSLRNYPNEFQFEYGFPDTSKRVVIPTRADYLDRYVNYKMQLECPILGVDLFVFESNSIFSVEGALGHLIVAQSSDSFWIVVGNLYTDTGLYRYPLEKYFDYVNRELLAFPFQELDSSAAIAVAELPLSLRRTIQSGVSAPRLVTELGDIPGGELHSKVLHSGWKEESMYSFLKDISPPVAQKTDSGFVVELYFWEWEHDIVVTRLSVTNDNISIIEIKKLGSFGIDFPKWILAPEGYPAIGH